MGLDITAYRGLKKLEDCVFNSEGYPIDRQTEEEIYAFRPYDNTDFPGRIGSLEGRAFYSYEEYQDVFSRSYGSYNRWRDDLAKLAGYPVGGITIFGVFEKRHTSSVWNGDITEGPFYELINFADNEGTLGPEVCAKLLRDFQNFDSRAASFEASDKWFYQHYTDFLRGLELAADRGAIKFS